MATARVPVLSDSDIALPAADTPKWRLNSGSSGCTVYSRPKVENPARNSATAVRRNAGVPCWMRVSTTESEVRGRPLRDAAVSPVMGSKGRGGGRRGGTGTSVGPSIQSIHNLMSQDRYVERINSA